MHKLLGIATIQDAATASAIMAGRPRKG